MLNTLQCHQPLPPGASGSNSVTAKLCVPAGSPDQDSAGETFWPPHWPNTWRIAIAPPLRKSGLVTANPAASAGAATAANIGARISARPALLMRLAVIGATVAGEDLVEFAHRRARALRVVPDRGDHRQEIGAGLDQRRAILLRDAADRDA